MTLTFLSLDKPGALHAFYSIFSSIQVIYSPFNFTLGLHIGTGNPLFLISPN